MNNIQDHIVQRPMTHEQAKVAIDWMKHRDSERALQELRDRVTGQNWRYYVSNGDLRK